MRVILNNQEFVFPSSLAEFTLGQRIDFHNQYGRQLDAMLKSVLEMEEGLARDLELIQFQMEKMFATFSFFSGVPVDVLKSSAYLDEITNIYMACVATLFDEEQAVELLSEIVWMGEVWELHAPQLKNGSTMTFGEFIDSKQILQDMHELGSGKWESMLRLAAIYFRKKGEAYDETFLDEGSERQQQMRSLPMNITLAVGFFLSSSMNIYLNTLAFSSLPGPNPLANLASPTLRDMVGSTS